MEDDFDDPTMIPDIEESGGEDDTHFRWDEEFQRHIIAMLVTDKHFLMQSMSLLRPSYFTNKVHQKLCSLLFKYFNKYRIVPKRDFLVQEIKTDLGDNKALPYYLSEVKVLTDYFQPGLEHREYLTDKIRYFAKMQSFRKAFSDGLKEMEKNPESEETWDNIYELMRTAMMTDTNFEIGINYFREVRERYQRMQEDEQGTQRFMIGLPSIDTATKGGGYGNGVIAIVADSGVGKSVMLANIVATNTLRGKLGLYVTLEISEDEVGERLDAIFTGLPVQTLLSTQTDVFQKLEEIEKSEKTANEDTLVLIKQFPTKKADVNTLQAYLNQLKFHGFKPDFMIVDYVAGLKHHPNMKTYESRELLVEELHALSVEEDLFIATAMQPNRGSKEAQKEEHKHIGQEHLADAYGAMRPLTACVMLMQTDNERSLGIGRAWVEKQRHGESHYFVYFRFDKATLRFTEITKDDYVKALNKQKAHGDDAVMGHLEKNGVKIPQNSVQTQDEKMDSVISGWSPSGDGDKK